MDQGRPLEQSPPGPWTKHIQSKATPLPILQSHPKMAFRTTTNLVEPEANRSSEVPQSTAILPLQYDSLMALVDLSRRALRDPLSMCLPLFAHAAFSEVQFLNLMESRIQLQISAIVEDVSADALGTLQYYTQILNRHCQQLKETTRSLCKLAERCGYAENGVRVRSPFSGRPHPELTPSLVRRQTSDSETTGSAGFSSSDGPFTLKGLTEDYENLHARCLELSQMCTTGITLAMNKAMIEEAHKGIEQSRRVKKLTLLATLFIPLNLVSSLMGMNIDLLVKNAVDVWWYFVICIPVTIFASIFYLWDTKALKRTGGRSWTRVRRIVRTWSRGKVSEKDPARIV